MELFKVGLIFYLFNIFTKKETLGIADDNADIKSAPLLNGGFTSESKITNGVLESAQVSEEYTFLPFSTDEAGARAKVNTKMSIVGSPSAGVAPETANFKLRTILFEKPATVQQGTPAALKSVFQKTLAVKTLLYNFNLCF